MQSSLSQKRILLGVSGSIAAYKSAVLTRLLIRAGAETQVVMTPAAAGFITPLTLSTLSKRPVFSDVTSESGWNNHVEISLWADAMVIAPATANMLAKMAQGICDNMVGACYLSARCPVLFAPAMDIDMWKHPATRRNIKLLEAYGHHLIPVGHGELASGLIGDGRMAEPETILQALVSLFSAQQQLAGKRFLITAGPTYEAIDPVRFIGNRSSGKMGIALAEEALRQGADVELVLGPSSLQPHPGIHLTRVENAREMYEAALRIFPDCDAAILSAAVADYRPREAAPLKIKKNDQNLLIELVKNPDIAASLGEIKSPRQRIIGFALETHDAENQARQKLARKNFDCIVLNNLNDPGAGFHVDTNKISIFFPDNKRKDFELKSKEEVAVDILRELAVLWPTEITERF